MVGTLIFATLVLVPYVQPGTMRSPLHHLRAVALHLAPGEDIGSASGDRAGGTPQPAEDSSSGGPKAQAQPSLLAPRQPEQRQKQEWQEEQQEQEQQKQQQAKQPAMQEAPPPPLQRQQQHPPPQRPQPLPQPPPADQQQAAATQGVKSPAVKMQPIEEPIEDPEEPQEPEAPPAVTSRAEDWKEGMAFHASQYRCTVMHNGERQGEGAAVQLVGVCHG